MGLDQPAREMVFLRSRQDVMDAVQRMRREGPDFGYLRSNGQVIVGGNGRYFEMVPINRANGRAVLSTHW